MSKIVFLSAILLYRINNGPPETMARNSLLAQFSMYGLPTCSPDRILHGNHYLGQTSSSGRSRVL